jgi:hypothetical protein
MLRRVFGSKRDKLTGKWIRLEDIYYLYSSPTLILVLNRKE